MRRVSLEQQAVCEVAENVAGSAAILRRCRIDPSSRMALSVAAEAASVTTDELLALVEERQQRAARRIARLRAHPEYRYMREEHEIVF